MSFTWKIFFSSKMVLHRIIVPIFVKHRYCNVCLNKEYLNHWISRKGPIEGPDRSPDLSSLDFFFFFFLWDYLKKKLSVTPVQNITDLLTRILTYYQEISANVISNMRQDIKNRLYYCMAIQTTFRVLYLKNIF